MHKQVALRPRASRGFTLLELLIVITIIGILTSILTVGYGAYRKNALNAKIASVVNTYQSAVAGVSFENNDEGVNTFVCAAKQVDSPCCTPATIAQWVCGNNTMNPPFVVDNYNNLQKYLTNDDTKSLPNLNMEYLGACPTSTIYAGTAPCDAQNIAYGKVNTPTGYLASLIYYLPQDYDCQSPQTLAFDSNNGTWSKQSGTKFSRRVTSGPKPFTECVVALK